MVATRRLIGTCYRAKASLLSCTVDLEPSLRAYRVSDNPITVSNRATNDTFVETHSFGVAHRPVETFQSSTPGTPLGEGTKSPRQRAGRTARAPKSVSSRWKMVRGGRFRARKRPTRVSGRARTRATANGEPKEDTKGVSGERGAGSRRWMRASQTRAVIKRNSFRDLWPSDGTVKFAFGDPSVHRGPLDERSEDPKLVIGIEH